MCRSCVSLQHTVQYIYTCIRTYIQYYNADLMVGQSLRCWPKIEPTLEECTMFERKPFCQYKRGVSCFTIPAVKQSVSLQTQHTAKSFELGLNYYLINATQVYMALLWFGNLIALNMRRWVRNTYSVLLWNRASAYPSALLHSGGPVSCVTVDYIFKNSLNRC